MILPSLCVYWTIFIILILRLFRMHSTISNEFNFQYELDISQTKQKEMFTTKQGFGGFAFEDFMNVGDKTIKSDKQDAKHSSSVMSKKDKEHDKEQDSNANPNILQNLSEYPSLRQKRTFSNSELLTPLTNTVLSAEKQLGLVTTGPSPKFAENVSRNIAINQNASKQFTLRMPQNPSQTPTTTKSTKIAQKPHVNNFINAFKKKPLQKDKQKEQEYLQIEKQIRYYQDSLQKMVYQSSRMEEQTQKLIESLSSVNFEDEMQKHTRQIKKINQEIQEQKNLETQLAKMVTQVSEQYEVLANSIKTSNFPRPLIIRDQANAIIDQINALKAEFQAIERDDGSLNLSSTLFQQPGNSQLSTFRANVRKDNDLGVGRIREIFEQNKVSADPRFLTNIKMACLREEWNIYSNGEVHVNVSYREFPIIKLQIGNKRNKDLQKFVLKQDGISKYQGEIIAAKSFIVHTIELKQELVTQLFIKCQISYTIETEQCNILIYVPVGLINFGHFSPITDKEFRQDAGKDEFKYCGSYRVLDKKLISNIEEITVYLPNLLVDSEQQIAYGLFFSAFNESTLFIIRQKGEMVSIRTKTQSWSMLRLLEFIMSV